MLVGDTLWRARNLRPKSVFSIQLVKGSHSKIWDRGLRGAVLWKDLCGNWTVWWSVSGRLEGVELAQYLLHRPKQAATRRWTGVVLLGMERKEVWVELQRLNLYDVTADWHQEDEEFRDDCDVSSLGVWSDREQKQGKGLDKRRNLG